MADVKEKLTTKAVIMKTYLSKPENVGKRVMLGYKIADKEKQNYEDLVLLEKEI
jgi:hypothetical protein